MNLPKLLGVAASTIIAFAALDEANAAKHVRRPAKTDAASVQVPTAPAPNLGIDPHWVQLAGKDCWAFVRLLPRTLESTWTGGCKDRLIEGQGKLTWTGSGEVDTGSFHAGKMNGPGQKDFKDGSHLEANFVDDLPDGQGKYYSADGLRFEGMFRSGKANGTGTVSYRNGTHYEGEFKDGKYDGHGTIVFSRDGSYSGSFREGAFDGHGVRTFPTGTTIEATYFGGVAGGDAIYRTADGAVFRGRVVEPAKDAAFICEEPEYPKLARRLGQQGDVVVALMVDINGYVTGVRVAQSSNIDELDQAALEAAKICHLKPGTVGGQPVEMEYYKRFTFHLTR
jgi:TonB family protein